MRAIVRRIFASQETGLAIVVVLVTVLLTALAGSHLFEDGTPTWIPPGRVWRRRAPRSRHGTHEGPAR